MLHHGFLFLTLLGMQAAGTPVQLPQAVQEQLQSAARAEQSGDWSAAEQAYRAALEIQPEFAPLHAKLGLIHQFQGRFTEAVASIERALTTRAQAARRPFLSGSRPLQPV